ncbi:MAG TPA: FHA domain-containing protein, partial [Steroidobacteraceae bacterium]|nr:FHA domain-containing protein [Steroidobacteraceae bacterium]
ALAAEQARATQLEGELGRVRDEMEDWGSALKSAQQERDGHLAAIATAESRARELEQRVGLSTEEVRVLQMGSEAVTTRVRELESDLRVAEEAVHRLESEARTRNARLEELEKANQHWRAIEEARQETRHGATDTAANQVLREAARQVGEAAAPQPEPAPAPDGTVRLLIVQGVDGREVVHVLGRKTSIGRTPDNDVQIDAKFVSRHHAVILAGPAQTIIEDLNSTNGVQVNGRRVSRHALKDGDQVAIGRTQYRFAVRKSAEKR